MWRLDHEAALPLWRPEGADDSTLAFTTRRGGVSTGDFESLNVGGSSGDREQAVRENRGRVFDALGLDAARLATAGLVHGAEIAEVRAPGHTTGCDALLTRERGLTLAVTTADCLPLILSLPGTLVVAHCGWRGTAASLPRRALEAGCAAASRAPREAVAHLGPAIRPCCYEVGPEVARQFPAAVVRLVEGRHRLDLAAAVRLQLLDSGVPPEAIFDTAACTCCSPAWYFSYRRQGSRYGRHWALAAMS
jgi:purine-nucleoside/S-methyl-5'-thioadenosine phosphorylase / adenosine deaminase